MLQHCLNTGYSKKTEFDYRYALLLILCLVALGLTFTDGPTLIIEGFADILTKFYFIIQRIVFFFRVMQFINIKGMHIVYLNVRALIKS